MVFQLNKRLVFPDPHLGEEDGLLAIGGDLSVDRLLLAYSNGIFPWYAFKYEVIQWWCPMDRFVIFPEKIHVSHSMRTLFRKNKYSVSMNQAFPEVIRNCGKLREDLDGAWLGPQMIEAYTRLYEQGFATSVEVWEREEMDGPSPQPSNRPSPQPSPSMGRETGSDAIGMDLAPMKRETGSDAIGMDIPREEDTGCDSKLVGGLYGVALGKCFFGESMFSLVPSASKIALIFLAEKMKEVGGVMIDCQFETKHLKTMGGEHITYDEYMKIITNY